MTILAIILGYFVLYFAWEALAARRMWIDAEDECDELREALRRGGRLIADASQIVDESMSTIVMLARAHTIVCDTYGEDVDDQLRSMCGREYDQYVKDE